MKKKTMAVVRGCHPRMTEIKFYSYFKNIKIRFIGDKSTGWVIENKIPKNIEYINLPLKPAWLFDPVSLFFSPLDSHRFWKYIDGLEKYLKDVDIINISDNFYFYCGQCARLAKKLGKKLVPIVWESIPNHPSTYIPPYCFNVKAVLDNADLFISRSQRASNYLNSIGVKKNKIRMVYKGIDTKDFYPDFKRKSNKIKILYVGQIVKSKGINELLSAFIRLCAEFDNLELWFCARSLGVPLEKKIKNLAKKYPIKCLGHISYNKLPQIYRQCQIYCQLSQEFKYFGILPGGDEWFSYAIVEAMASGLAVVATNIGGIPEQLGEGNILVRQKDAESAYLGLKKLILSPKKRLSIGKKNVQRARKLFNIQKQAIETEKEILKVLK